MEIKDCSPHYYPETMLQATLTYEGPLKHPTFGLCQARIYRAIRTDNMYKYRMSVRILSEGEPNIGFWEGDVIQYFQDGILVDVKK